MMSNMSRPDDIEHLVVYDPPTMRALLVNISDPAKVAVLPQATDFFVARHRLSGREYVTSAVIQYMHYAAQQQPC